MSAILRCIWSRSVRGQFFALTQDGLYRSDNYGNGWVTVVAANAGETFRDVNISFKRIMIAMAGGRLLCDQTGAAQTLPANSGDIYAVTADIRRDRFYAYDSAGNTFAHTADGGTSLGARHALPAAATVRGLWRDEHIPSLLYLVAGGAAYKSVDGLGSAGGYFLLRAANGYAQIGTDGALTQAPQPSTSYPTNLTAKALNLATANDTNGAPPSGWQQPAFDDSGWPTVVQGTGSGLSIPLSPPGPGGGPWVNTLSAYTGSQTVLRQHITLPTGAIAKATFTVACDDNLLGVWINGVYIDPGVTLPYNFGGIVTTHLTLAIPPSLLRPGGDNVVAVWSSDNSHGTADQAGQSWALAVQ